MTESDLTRRAFLVAVAVAAGGLSACVGDNRERKEAGAGSSAATSTAQRRRWPGEWEPHESTLMSMPYRPEIYGRRLGQIQTEWANVVTAIARFEPVVVVVPPGRAGDARDLIGSDVETVELPYDDMWVRDNGPIVVVEPDGERTGLDWEFDGWGGAFDAFGTTWHKDDRLPPPLLKELGIPREPVWMVLEGGAVMADGDGTILTTEECLLEAGRNPSMDRTEIETELLERFGADRVIWLPYGLIGDLTAGHVDGVAAWIGPGSVVAQIDPADAAEQARLGENIAVLRSSTDATGAPIEVAPFPILPRGSFGGMPELSFTYLNFVFAGEGLVVPATGDPSWDDEALRALGEMLPDREIVGVPAPAINWAGGGVHCITQQIPASRPT